MNLVAAPPGRTFLVVALLGGWLAPAAVSAQGWGDDPGFVHESWTIADGLPQDSVTSIVQTGDGYLWLGTFGGLARFDGTRFQIYDIANTEGFTSNRILSLCESRDGSLWIGTQDAGVIRHRSGVFTGYEHAENGPQGMVWDIVEDDEGAVWFAGKRLVRFSEGVFEEETPVSTNAEAQVLSLFVDGADLWIGTTRGLALRRDGAFEVFTQADGLPHRGVRSIVRDGRGVLWVGAENALAYLSGERFVTALSGPEVGTPFALTSDSRGRTWACTGRGIYRTHTTSVTPFERVSSFPAGSGYRSCLEDREGNLWFGANGSGLLRVRAKEFVQLGEREGIRGEVTLVVADGGSGIWLRSSQSGIRHVEEGRLGTLPMHDSLPDARITGRVFVDREGAIWFSNSESFWRWDGTDYEEIEHGLGHAVELFEDGEGRLWAGSVDALVRFERGRPALYELPASTGKTVSVHVEDAAGAVWIAHGDLVWRFHDGDFRRFGPEEGLPGGTVRSIHEDDSGTFWISTYGGGLSRLADGVVTRYSTADGLPDNSLGKILEDDAGNLWINSNRGVFRVRLDDLNAFARGEVRRLQCFLLGTGEGNGGSGCKDVEGRLWFPTVKGVVVIDPTRLRANDVPPLVVIEELLVGDHPRSLEGEVVLPPGGGDLAIHYTALSFVDSGAVRFRTKLEGYDDDWIDVADRRWAYYTNLPPGKYRFLVEACNNDGVWSKQEASLAFVLQPHFYQTEWFLIASGLALAAGLFAAYRLRTRSIRSHNLALQREIEERHRVESALRESEERHRVVAEAAHDAIITIDEESRILYANPAIERIFGYSPWECVGRSLTLLMPASSHNAHLDGMATFLLTRQKKLSWNSVELVGLHKDGREVPVELSMGELTGTPRFLVIGIVRDITERRKDEAEKSRLEERLRESKKMEAMGRLAGGISHDFNNILTALSSHAQLLEERVGSELPGPARQHLVEIQKCTEFAVSLTKQLLAFSRKQVAQPTVLDPGDVLSRLEPMLLRLIRENITLDISVPDEVGTIRADVGQIEQIVLNLVLNASDAMPEGGVLTVQAENVELDEIYAASHKEARMGPHVLVTVSDTGVGIEPQDLPRLFEPFFTTKSVGKGTGIGLTSVQNIVEQSGGHITVASASGTGTTFRVYLPRVEPADTALPQVEVPGPKSPLVGNETILVCDDYEAVRRATEMILGDKGYDVLTADKPERALEIAREHPTPIHLLVTDIVMPEMNGRQLATEVAKLQGGIKVLFVSGYTDDVLINEGLGDDGAWFLAKPFKFKELLLRIRELLDAPEEVAT